MIFFLDPEEVEERKKERERERKKERKKCGKIETFVAGIAAFCSQPLLLSKTQLSRFDSETHDSKSTNV